jgi:predicted ATP-dependent serine protease
MSKKIATYLGKEEFTEMQMTTLLYHHRNRFGTENSIKQIYMLEYIYQEIKNPSYS